jgi:hypothetical protein
VTGPIFGWVCFWLHKRVARFARAV